ncbi:MAG: type III pantothenate kinase [Flavobacteriaceae bacterium]|nr:type III pantothenate kinase [Flavobacteriaceae bacterium]
MADLVLDNGNTLLKIAVFKQDEICWIDRRKVADIEHILQEIPQEYSNTIDRIALSNVGSLSKETLAHLKTIAPVLEIDKSLRFPFKNDYKTPETLGIDRMVLASGALAVNQGKLPVLIIDAGTCITYDFVNSKGRYQGGIIAPGVQMRYKAMHQYTHALPMLQPENLDKPIGQSTAECMHLGVMRGVYHETQAYLDEFQQNNKSLTIFLTGGDAKWLSEKLKNHIFADPNLLLKGLKHLLDLNMPA